MQVDANEASNKRRKNSQDGDTTWTSSGNRRSAGRDSTPAVPKNAAKIEVKQESPLSIKSQDSPSIKLVRKSIEGNLQASLSTNLTPPNANASELATARLVSTKGHPTPLSTKPVVVPQVLARAVSLDLTKPAPSQQRLAPSPAIDAVTGMIQTTSKSRNLHAGIDDDVALLGVPVKPRCLRLPLF